MIEYSSLLKIFEMLHGALLRWLRFLLGRGPRITFELKKQVHQTHTCLDLKLDGLVIIGGQFFYLALKALSGSTSF